MSAGIVWVPGNDHARDRDGTPDSYQAAIAYLRAGIGCRLNEARVDHFVRNGPAAIRFLQQEAGIPFQPLSYPDFYPDLPGATLAGRSLEVALFHSRSLGQAAGLVRRRGATYPAVLISERGKVDEVERERRVAEGIWGVGAALAGHLIRACLERGVVFHRRLRARQWEWSRDRVAGVRFESPAEAGAGQTILTATSVVLATGGFEWNDTLLRAYLHPPVAGAVSPAGNEGDGLAMALAAGAAVGEMAEAWWTPMIEIESHEVDQGRVFIPAVGERARRHCIMVNRSGQRFVNEARNYTDVALAIQTEHNPAQFPNDPCWMVMDANCASGGLYGGLKGDHGQWLRPYPSLADLAADTGIDPVSLQRTVDRFNHWAEQGRDPDFGRGESPYDIYLGDGAADDASATLAPLQTPPFYALRLRSGVFGTHGGPQVDLSGQVLDGTGTPIPGLYAAGNVAAGMFGSFYPGPGATLGPAIVGGCWAGWAAAQAATRDSARRREVR